MVLLRRFSAAAAAVSCLVGRGGCAQPGPGASAPAAQVSAAAARSPDQALLAAAQAEKAATIKTLERLVNIETGTGDAQGMAAMAELLEGELRALGATVTRHKAAEGRLMGKSE